MLCASVLALVAGAPTQAANTSFEVKYDHDNKASTDTVRQFAGTDRYDTAIRLANGFGDRQLGSISTAFVASGRALVDAVSVAGLAGYLGGPVLLTYKDRLHPAVANYIEDYGIGQIYVLGGSAVVDDTVVDALLGLTNKPKVERFAGTDRYETAALISAKLGAGASWCGSIDQGAILVNGANKSLVDAIAISPLAYRLQLPILLTTSDEMPQSTADFIQDNKVRNVVIIGGEKAVSKDIEAALTSAGVSDIDRISGATAADTSVQIAKLATGDCASDLGSVANNRVALVNRNGLADGIAAGPYLGKATNALQPVLVIGDTLPVEISDYLASTPDEDTAGVKIALGVLALGGTSAVSDAVMTAALKAAASAGDLTVDIRSAKYVNNDGVTLQDVNKDGTTGGDGDLPQPGDDAVALSFSDDVSATDLLNRVRDMLFVNGAPARIQSASQISGGSDGCKADVVGVRFSSNVSLKAGDVVSISGNTVKIGDNDDQRTVAAASVTVPSPAKDTTPPAVAVKAIVGQTDFVVSVTDAGGLLATDLLVNSEVKISSSGRTLTANVSNGGDANITVNVVNSGAGGNDLKSGDRITIISGAFTDKGGNKNRPAYGNAVAATASPRLASVTMSNPTHSKQAAWTIDSTRAGNLVTTSGDKIVIKAKKDGAGAGAVGNDWGFYFNKLSSHKAASPVDIKVYVTPQNKSVTVRIDNGTPKYNDLVDALNGNDDFTSLFSVSVLGIASGTTCTYPNRALGNSGNYSAELTAPDSSARGETKFAIEARFNGYVREIGDTNLLTDILDATVKRNAAANATIDTVRSGLKLAGGDLGDSTNPTKMFTAPATMVRYEATTESATYLPQRYDLVTTTAGTASDNAIATGYAPNLDTTTDVDERYNAATSLRLGVSSSVKAPK